VRAHWQTLPNADIQIEGLGDGVMLTGSAASPIEAQQAGELAARLVGGADKVVNSTWSAAAIR
jgi:pilus assembly protein CpaC